jgi:hypothetical protein
MSSIDPLYNNLVIVFECKNCKSIIDVAHIKEMGRFIQQAVDDPDWGKICKREP